MSLQITGRPGGGEAPRARGVQMPRHLTSWPPGSRGCVCRLLHACRTISRLWPLFRAWPLACAILRQSFDSVYALARPHSTAFAGHSARFSPPTRSRSGPRSGRSRTSFSCFLGGYYIIRPVRDAMGVAGGVAQSAVDVHRGLHRPCLVVVPLFGALVARLPRRRFVPVGLSVLCLLNLRHLRRC